MLVSEILETVRPAYCDSWEQAFELLRAAPHEWRRVEELMGELQEVGQEKPGMIDLREPDEEEGENFEPYYYLANGTHRFVAAVQLGLEDFSVQYGYEDSEEDSYEMTEVELWLNFRHPTKADPENELEDERWECLTSSANFRVAPGVWAECGGGSSQNIRHGSIYTLHLYPLPKEHLRTFLRELLARVSCCVKPEDISDINIKQTISFEQAFWKEN